MNATGRRREAIDHSLKLLIYDYHYRHIQYEYQYSCIFNADRLQ